MKDYLGYALRIEKICEDFKKEIIEKVFTDEENKVLLENATEKFACWSPRFLEFKEVIEDLVEVCDVFGIKFLEERKPILTERVHLLKEPHNFERRKNFEDNVDLIKSTFKRVERELQEKISLLEDEEKDRLNEALNCYIEVCNYASVAMAVSAIESRLLNLMLSVNPNSRLEELTLGELIREYIDHKKDYRNIIPKKHEPLLNLCNTYRIFSVHPKKEQITKAIATSILNMTFTFLFDESMRVSSKMLKDSTQN